MINLSPQTLPSIAVRAALVAVVLAVLVPPRLLATQPWRPLTQGCNDDPLFSAMFDSGFVPAKGGETLGDACRVPRGGARVLVVLPDRGYDATEAAVPYAILRAAGAEVVFATETGAAAQPDPIVLRGYMLRLLGASRRARDAHAAMAADPAFQSPLKWADVASPGAAFPYDAVLFPGGHHADMRTYLFSEEVAHIAKLAGSRDGVVVAAICHGVLPLARSGAFAGRTVTTVPAWMERIAYFLTYPVYGSYHLDTTAPQYTEDLVGALLRVDPGPLSLADTLLLSSGTDDRMAHIVVDGGDLVTGRFPGDAYALGKAMLTMIKTARVNREKIL
jgi:protease I